jgi:hypothetical protein
MTVQEEGDEPLFPEDEPIKREGWAFNSINVSFTDSRVQYVRNTHVIGAVPTEPSILFYHVVAELTTHADLFLQINIQFKPNTFMWQNYTEFINSGLIDDYNRTVRALLDLTNHRVRTSFFDISAREFTTDFFDFPEYNPENDSFTIEKRYQISDLMILRETSAFILTLDEPFPFDINNIQLGDLSDFRYEVNFVNEGEIPFLEEKIRLTTTGGPLSYVLKTNGYTGTVYFNQFHPETLSNYTKHPLDVKQQMFYAIKMPSGQELSYSFDSEYQSRVEKQEMNVESKGNTIWLFFESGDVVPQYVKLDSKTPEIPLLQQFSVQNYASFALSGLIGLVTILKGLPMLLNRRSTGKIKSVMRKSMKANDYKGIQSSLNQAFEKFSAGELSLNQYKEIQNYGDFLEHGFSNLETNK